MKRFLSISMRFALVVTVFSVAIVGLLRDNTAIASSADLKSALPTQDEMPGFVHLSIRETPNGGVYRSSFRRTDKMYLRIEVYTAPSEAEAQKLVKNATTSALVTPMPRVAPSGRLIGQEVWASQGGTPRGGFQLTTRDGRSVVVIQATLPVKGRDARGKAILPPFSSADLNLFENLAIARLNKLAAMGLTSGGPVVRASATKKNIKPSKRAKR